MKQLLLSIFIVVPILSFSQTYMSVDTIRVYIKNSKGETKMFSEELTSGLFKFNKDLTVITFVTTEKTAYYYIKEGTMFRKKSDNTLEFKVVSDSGNQFDVTADTYTSKILMFAGHLKEGTPYAVTYSIKKSLSD